MFILCTRKQAFFAYFLRFVSAAMPCSRAALKLLGFGFGYPNSFVFFADLGLCFGFQDLAFGWSYALGKMKFHEQFCTISIKRYFNTIMVDFWLRLRRAKISFMLDLFEFLVYWQILSIINYTMLT